MNIEIEKSLDIMSETSNKKIDKINELLKAAYFKSIKSIIF